MNGQAPAAGVEYATFQEVVTSVAELRAIVGEPSEVARRKEIAALDEHCRAFIERSPFLLLGTAGAEGRCDVSPKGDAPGFVLVLDEQMLAIPDRPGNRRVDSLSNIVENPHVGLLFLIPGLEETLRVNGRAQIVRDAALLDRLAVQGKRPLLAIVVEVQEAFLHCARSFKRAGLWNGGADQPRAELPTLARMLMDQVGPTDCTLDELEARVEHSYRNLY